MVNVIIPYIKSEAQGNELLYAIQGWKKHFKYEHQIIVVGDYIDIIPKDVIYLKYNRTEKDNINYRANLDIIRKLKYAIDKLNLKEFIYTCDDIYAINDFSLNDIKITKIFEDEMSVIKSSLDCWITDLYKTKECCRKNNLPIKDYVCHLPVLFNSEKFNYIINKYDCLNNSYVIENLYFNTFIDDNKIYVCDSNYLSIFNKQSYKYDIDNVLKNKTWIVNSVENWCDELNNILYKHYFDNDINNNSCL